MAFRENLLHLRQEHNMTQEQLAMLVGVSRQSVTKWEADRATPEMDKLLKMCDLFDCTLDELVKGDLTEREAAFGQLLAPEAAAADVTGYDEQMRGFAAKVALGVGLFVLSAAGGALSDIWVGGIFLLFVLVATGLLFVVPAVFARNAFEREHPFIVDFYTAEDRKRIATSRGWEMASGIAVILLSVGAMAVLDERITNLSAGAVAAACMLVGIAVGVGLITHAALLGSRVDVEDYNLDALSERDRDEIVGIVGEERADQVLARLALRRKIDAACGVIMLLATVVALALLFLPPEGPGSYKMFWVPWMLGGILCGVAAIVLTVRNQA